MFPSDFILVINDPASLIRALISAWLGRGCSLWLKSADATQFRSLISDRRPSTPPVSVEFRRAMREPVCSRRTFKSSCSVPTSASVSRRSCAVPTSALSTVSDNRTWSSVEVIGASDMSPSNKIAARALLPLISESRFERSRASDDANRVKRLPHSDIKLESCSSVSKLIVRYIFLFCSDSSTPLCDPKFVWLPSSFVDSISFSEASTESEVFKLLAKIAARSF